MTLQEPEIQKEGHNFSDKASPEAFISCQQKNSCHYDSQPGQCPHPPLTEFDHINPAVKHQQITIPANLNKIVNTSVYCTAVLFHASAVHYTDLGIIIKQNVSSAYFYSGIGNIKILCKPKASINGIYLHGILLVFISVFKHHAYGVIITERTYNFFVHLLCSAFLWESAGLYIR